MRRTSALVAIVLLTPGPAWPKPEEFRISAIVTSARSRAAYLGHAVMWSDPGPLSADDILAGPPDVFPYSASEALDGVACTFVTPGKELGGNTPKFMCATADGKKLRVKFWDPEREAGNREVFAMVAATRLMWALGFDVVHAMPLNVHCDGCPRNPASGEGPTGSRDYVSAISVHPGRGPKILSHDDGDQGWSWRELDEAIRALPPGPERTRQRTHFEALTLLGVFLQHGDRKPEQQILFCDAPVDTTAGERRISLAGNLGGILVERRDASACPKPAVAIADVGATFGGAGRTSSGVTATMDLDSWRRRTVFEPDDHNVCRGRLTVSLAAGRGGEGDPEISEDGRRFLLDQLHRLTPAHVRAIFTAARIDQLQTRHGGAAAGGPAVLDEWVAAFQDKVRQIEARRCGPASEAPAAGRAGSPATPERSSPAAPR